MSKNSISSTNLIMEAPREYRFDNIRAVLIVLVVFGHILTSMMKKSDVIESIYFYIFFFHMPGMVFISGYFSKNIDKIRNTAFEMIFMPYLILNICNYFFKILILKEVYFGFRFFEPLWGLWYLFALFLWKFFLRDLVRIRFILPISFLVAILSGFSKEFADYLALGRIVCFLPFFLLGYYCTKEHIDKILRMPKFISVAILLISGGISVYIVKYELFKAEVLYLRRSYPPDSEIEAMLYRILVYVLAILMMIAIINLMSNKKCVLSLIGTSTMTIYVLHLFTIPILKKFEILKNQPYLYLVYTVVMTSIIVFIYSRPVVKRIYDTVMYKLTGFVIRRAS